MGQEALYAANYGKPPHSEVLSSGDVVKCMPPMVVACTGDSNSSAPKEPRLGRLLAVVVAHLDSSDGKSHWTMCLVRFSDDTPDCFVALKSVKRCVLNLEEPHEELPEAVKWGSDLEQVPV